MSDGGDSTSCLRMFEFIRSCSTDTRLGTGEVHYEPILSDSGDQKSVR
jgi:hypothetical protein